MFDDNLKHLELNNQPRSSRMNEYRYLIGKVPNSNLYNLYRYDITTGNMIYLYQYTDAQSAINMLATKSDRNGKEIKRLIEKELNFHIIVPKDTILHSTIMNIIDIIHYLGDPDITDLFRLIKIYQHAHQDDVIYLSNFTNWDIFIEYSSINPMVKLYMDIYNIILIKYNKSADKINDMTDDIYNLFCTFV